LEGGKGWGARKGRGGDRKEAIRKDAYYLKCDVLWEQRLRALLTVMEKGSNK